MMATRSHLHASGRLQAAAFRATTMSSSRLFQRNSPTPSKSSTSSTRGANLPSLPFADDVCCTAERTSRSPATSHLCNILRRRLSSDRTRTAPCYPRKLLVATGGECPQYVLSESLPLKRSGWSLRSSECRFDKEESVLTAVVVLTAFLLREMGASASRSGSQRWKIVRDQRRITSKAC